MKVICPKCGWKYDNNVDSIYSLSSNGQLSRSLNGIISNYYCPKCKWVRLILDEDRRCNNGK